MKLLHPFMPFITEEIFSRLQDRKTAGPPDSIMLAEWPKADGKAVDEKAEEEMTGLMEVVRAVRNIRAEFNVPHGKEIEVVLVSGNPINESYLKTLAKVGRVTLTKKLDQKPAQSASAIAAGLEVYVLLAGLIDLEKETARINKEKEKLEAELEKIKGRLADPNFIARANPESVEKEKQREIEFSNKIQVLQERLKDLSA